jgi:molybdate-binding protein
VRDPSLGFLPLTVERYDFVAPKRRLDRQPVQAFCRLLSDKRVRAKLVEMGFKEGQP